MTVDIIKVMTEYALTVTELANILGEPIGKVRMWIIWDITPDDMEDKLKSNLKDIPTHFNPKTQLPPVDCPLLIKVNGVLMKAHREQYAISKDSQLEYVTEHGVIIGRYDWTYP